MRFTKYTILLILLASLATFVVLSSAQELGKPMLLGDISLGSSGGNKGLTLGPKGGFDIGGLRVKEFSLENGRTHVPNPKDKTPPKVEVGKSGKITVGGVPVTKIGIGKGGWLKWNEECQCWDPPPGGLTFPKLTPTPGKLIKPTVTPIPKVKGA